MIENWVNVAVLLCFFEVRFAAENLCELPRFYFKG